MNVLTENIRSQARPQFPALLLALLPFAVGGVLGLLAAGLGPLALVVVIGVAGGIWLIRDPFRVYLWLIITWPILTLFLRIELPAGLPDLRYERILLLLALVLILARALAFRKKLPALAFWVGVYAVVQIFFYGYRLLRPGPISPDIVILINATLIPLGMYWLTRALVVSGPQLRWLMAALVLASLLVAASGFYERAIDASDSPFPVETGTASGGRYGGVPRGRAAGVMGNPAIYGAVLGVGLLASLGLYLHANGRPARALWAFLGMVLAYGVFVSFTRSAWLSNLAALFLALFFMKDLKKWVPGLAVIGTAALALVGLVAFDQLMDNRVIQNRILEPNNVIGRVDRAIYSWERFVEAPLIGWGPDALDAFIAVDFRAEGTGFDSSHNSFLTLLVDGGLLVFASFAALLAHWLHTGRQVFRRTRPGGLRRTILGAMLGTAVLFLFSGLFLELKFFSYFNALFWIAGGVIENLNMPAKRESLGERLPTGWAL